jgi:hypothetical protein
LIQDFLVGLAIAAVTGITFLAYQHPKIYAYADEPLNVLCFAALLGVLGYSSGYTNALSFVGKRGDIPIGAWDQVPDPILSSGVCLAVYMYLKFLKYVVSNLKESDRQDKDDGRKS